MKKPAIIIPFLFLFFLLGCGSKTDQTVHSPDGKIIIQFKLVSGVPYYTFHHNSTVILKDSRLGFHFKDEPPLDGNFQINNTHYRTFDETWTQPWGEVKDIRNHYNEMKLCLQEKTKPFRKMNLIFRVFNDGIGFRYELPEQENLNAFQITDELTEFNFSGDHRCWWIGAYQGNRYEFLFNETKLSEIDTVHTPFTLETDDGLYLSLHEANLTDYSSMALARVEGTKLTCDLYPWSDGTKVKASTPMQTPWRTLQIAESPGDLITSYLILNLNEPCKIDDPAWITPQKYVGIWWEMHLGKSTWGSGEKHGATTENAKKYIYFAANYGFDGVLVEGWNVDWDGDWIQNGSIFNFTQPHPDYDVDEVTQYAASKGVKIIGHHETGADVLNYERQMEDAFAFCLKHGINTIKTGYVGHGQTIKRIDENGDMQKEWHHGQYMVRHYRKVIETAAKYHIMLDVHEPIKDTGIRRTWPNMMTREGARGMEYDAWSPDGGNPPDYMTILPFTRLLSGPMDFTPGIVDLFYEECQPNNRINATLAKMLAYYVIIYSPLHMAADFPENYEKQMDAFQFIRDVPVDWEETRVLNAEIGDYLTIVRKDRNSDDWYLGSVTDENSRTLEVKLDFLDSKKRYFMEKYEDDANANWQENPLAIRIRKKIPLFNRDSMILRLAPGGGVAIRFIPMTEEDWEEYNYNGPVKEFHHPDPGKLINEYLKRDAAGDFMRSNPWYATAKLHPIGSGWDQAMLISGYKVGSALIDSSQAVCEVSYDLVAWITQNIHGPYLVFGSEKKIVRFELEKTPWGWRIAKPSQPPHILPNVIMDRLPDEDQEKLKAYLKQQNLMYLLD
ncbi:glycoside hydrolase family 97 protein [bacterium]|nr:glycoside hydrolase family 97 protein [bacterium]